MVSVLQASPRIMPADRIASLVCGLVNTKTLTAIFEHLRHEGEFVEASILVERSEDFLFAQDLDPVACARFHVQSSCPDPERCTWELSLAYKPMSLMGRRSKRSEMTILKR